MTLGWGEDLPESFETKTRTGPLGADKENMTTPNKPEHLERQLPIRTKGANPQLKRAV